MQALKGVVIIMTLTIAVLMTLIVYGMYQKSQNPDFKFFDLGGDDKAVTAPQQAASATAQPSTQPQTGGRAFGDITLPLAPGAQMKAATVSGNRLVVITAGPDGEQVWVVDMTSGQVLGRVKGR